MGHLNQNSYAEPQFGNQLKTDCLGQSESYSNQQEASITWCDIFQPKRPKTPETITSHAVLESLKQAHLANHVVWCSLAKFAARSCRGFLTCTNYYTENVLKINRCNRYHLSCTRKILGIYLYDSSGPDGMACLFFQHLHIFRRVFLFVFFLSGWWW